MNDLSLEHQFDLLAFKAFELGKSGNSLSAYRIGTELIDELLRDAQ